MYLTVPVGASADKIQQIINENPNRTLFFPDGEYLLDHPICTPAHPEKSVTLRLSDYAVLRAAPGWDSPEAMVRLGALCPANDIYTCGSNYGLYGGIIDGSGVASGISVDGGRETAVRGVSVKHTKIGLHVRHGANSGSSDCDIADVNITGSGTPDSVGVLLEGFDNTLTNMRIARVQIGVHLKSSGNSMRNIHPLFTCGYDHYTESCGFFDERGKNWYNFCYSDHFSIGFRFAAGGRSTVLDNCYAMWYSDRGESHTAVQADGQLYAMFSNFSVGFKKGEAVNTVLRAAEPGGKGRFCNLSVDETLTEDRVYRDYLNGVVF